MEEKKYKKFEDYDKEAMMDAVLRNLAFNTKCTVCGEKLPFAFSENNDKTYYNTEHYECKQQSGGLGKQASTPSVDVPTGESKTNLDDILDF